MADVEQAREDLDELIGMHRRRLQKLQVRVALEGRDARPEDGIEIENIEKEHQKLEQQRGVLVSSREKLSPDKAAEFQKTREKIEAKAQESLEIKAAFQNRDFELKTILDPFSKPFIIISAPAGYGKTHLLDKIEQRLQKSDKEERWLIIRHDCHRADKDTTILESLARKMDSRISEPIRNMYDFLFQVNRSLDAAKATGLVIQFDSVEQWKKDDQWIPAVRFMQGTFATEFSDAMRLGGRKFKIVFAGRYISDLADALLVPYQEIFLSPFDFRVIRAFIGETLRLFENLQSRRLGYSPEDIDYFAEQVLDVTGGHPRAMTRLIQDIGDRGFVIPLKAYFHPESKSQLFNDFVANEVEKLFGGVSPSMQEVFKTLSIFRGFNGDTLNALLDRGYIAGAGWKDGWELYSQIGKTHLTDNERPLSHDKILQRVLDAQIRFTEPAKYRELHQFAARLYDQWLQGKDRLGKGLAGGIPSGTDQVKLMVESLYHSCRLVEGQADAYGRLRNQIKSFVSQLKFLGGQAQGRMALRQEIEKDEQLPLLIKRMTGEKDYRTLRDLISS